MAKLPVFLLVLPYLVFYVVFFFVITYVTKMNYKFKILEIKTFFKPEDFIVIVKCSVTSVVGWRRDVPGWFDKRAGWPPDRCHLPFTLSPPHHSGSGSHSFGSAGTVHSSRNPLHTVVSVISWKYLPNFPFANQLNGFQLEKSAELIASNGTWSF